MRLYWNTIRGLAPEQLRGQVALRLRRLAPLPSPNPATRAFVEQVGWGWRVPRCRAPFEPRVLEGRFRFWGLERRLDLGSRWEAPDLDTAWNYPVHYFEAAPAIATRAYETRDAALRDALCSWFERWITAHATNAGVAWDAYPTALRIVNMLDTVHTLGEWARRDWRAQVLASVHAQARWLEHHLEWHLLGTHLLKDAKALALAGSVFADAAALRWRRRGTTILARELSRQVHADGGHLEPSPAYHALALEDVLDVLNFGLGGSVWRAEIATLAARMLEFLIAVRPPHGGHPLLGDAGLDAQPSPAELVAYARRLGVPVAEPVPGWRLFADSGLAVWRDARQFLLADVGPIGPPHLAGHGHCDSLSFEWHVDGMPFVVDTGTRTYAVGADRDHSRGTRAHNTLEIDGREQHEIWAAFRVARRAAVHAERESDTRVRADLVPWHDTRVRVRRRFEAVPGRLRITDTVLGPGTHTVTSRLHLHPECTISRDGRLLRLQHGPAAARIVLPADLDCEIVESDRSDSVYCASFGVPVPNAVIEIAWRGVLPWSCELLFEAGS